MEFEIDQAKDIITNPDNPNHAKYMQGNDKELAGAIDRAYGKAFPGKLDLNDDVSLDRQLSEAETRQPSPAEGAANVQIATPEAQAKIAEILGMAQGPEFQVVIEGMQGYVKSNFANYDEFYKMASDVEARMGPEKAIKMLNDAVRGSKAR